MGKTSQDATLAQGPAPSGPVDARPTIQGTMTAIVDGICAILSSLSLALWLADALYRSSTRAKFCYTRARAMIALAFNRLWLIALLLVSNFGTGRCAAR